ncbi:low-density lipoprotein receptor domain-containing jelly belly protein [Rhodnius prolixus]|uniref:low-density lipoprotein receptor domain-containing jelly belly protein n=1 Tax=Rhodnius prolixus TaxID=13249 RepID=UPI003D18D406
MAESVAYMSGIMTLIMMTWCLAQAGSHRTANVVVGGTPAWLSTGAAAEQQQEQQSSRGAEHHHTHQGGSSVSSVSSSSSAESAELLPADVGGGGGTNSKMMIRKTRGNRPYDVPQIECPPAEEDVMERFACPTPDRMGRYRCIDDHVLCDGFIDCPNAEDEDRQACMFFKTTKAHLDILADALLRWARGR